MKKSLALTLTLLCLVFSTQIFAQCVEGSAGGNPNLIDNGNNSYSIACDGGGVNITGNIPVPEVNTGTVQWTNGETNNWTFNPDCNNLGCQSFSPCIPAGTNISTQCVAFNTLGIPLSGSGNSFNLAFTISGICYVPGMTYGGELGINLSGSGNVSLSVVQPDGATQGPLTFDVSLINDLSPLPLSLLGLDVDPNGNWAISISGSGLTGYTIDGNSDICLEGLTTAGPICGDPIEICVFGGCPSFLGVNADQTEICSGGTVNLSADLDPEGAPNVTYAWSGNGIDGSNASLANPSVTITNTTCAPITETYTVDITCTNDGSVVASAQTVSVTVYPEIDLAAVVVDNTTNTTDPGCAISVTAPCGFAVSGPTAFSPSDNGTNAVYTITNGFAACDETVTAVVNCIGDCTPPDVTAVTTACDGSDQFTIEVTVNGMGDSSSADLIASDGTVQNFTAAGGPIVFGPYASGDVINIKVIDANDPNCSLNLGEFTEDCFGCPTLTAIDPIPADVCSGDIIPLVATTDFGTEGVDYEVQWYENGTPIAGGTSATYNHVANAGNRCNAATATYTAVVTCLRSTEASSTLDIGPVNIYPTPEEGIDFVFQNCSATPIDNCGSLTIDVGGAADPAPGASVNVNYTISANGAPASCATTGSATVVCPSCPDSPGNGQASDVVLCWGESVDFSNTSALVSTLGYEVGYAITPNPPSSYPSTNALIAASLNGANGAFAAPGSINGETYTNNGSLINPTDPCGEVLYFTPFLSFACQSYNAINESGTVITENLPGIDVPGVGGTTLGVPTVPYCSDGSVSYNIQVCVDDATTDGEEPLQEDALFGIIGGLPGGVFSAFPNIDDIHDSDGFPCYNQNGWTQDPSGEQIQIVTVNLLDLNPFELGPDELDWTFSVNVNCNVSFPTVCGDCDVQGAAVAVRFLPNETLDPIVAPAAICEGESINLLDLNPATNANGTFVWYEGPASGGAEVSDASNVVPPVGTTQYCVALEYCETGDCVVETCVSIAVNANPVINAPTLGPICPGSEFDLTSVEADIVQGAGSFEWNIGTGAAIADPTAVIPVGSEQYCATYTDAVGCSAEVCASFSYDPIPTLLAAAPIICEGTPLELTDYNTDFTTDPGTFVWYDADPGAGASPLASTEIDPVTDQSEFWVTFTSDASGCSATTSMIVTVTPAPTVTAPTATVCAEDPIDLTTLNATVSADAGTFVWYEGPSSGGITVADETAAVPMAGDEYCVVFTDDATTCSAEVCFTPTVNPLPVINDILTPFTYCADSGPYDVSTTEAALSTGTFTWYDDDPDGAGVVIDATMAALPNGAITTLWFEVESADGCVAVGSAPFEVYNPISGTVVAFDCTALTLSVDIAGTTGGSGTGYAVAAASPNNDGDVLADGDSYTVIIEDSFGCQQTISDMVMCCQAIAPNLAPLGADCMDGTLGAPLSILDNMDGSTNAGEITEYIVIDDAAGTVTGTPDAIVSVGSFAEMEAAIDTLEQGESLCFATITHSQTELDFIVNDLDVCTNGLATGLLGLSPAGNTLESIIEAIQDFSPGAIFTVAQIETLIGGGGGGPGAGGSVDIGELLGLPPGSLVCDVPPFCYNISTPICVVVGNCGCNATAPTIGVSGTDCGDGTTDEIVVADNGDGSSNAGEITEYIVVDDIAGTITGTPEAIVSVGDLASMQAVIDGLADGQEVCLTAITHDQPALDVIVQDLDVCTNGLATGLLGLSTTGNSVESIITAIQDFQATAIFTVAQIETLIGGGGGGPGFGGSVDIGELLGLPPGSLVCDVPPFCYNISASTCVTAGSCAVSCPVVTAFDTADDTCGDGGTQTICVTFDQDPTGTVTADLNGFNGTVDAVNNQICFTINNPILSQCAPAIVALTLTATCTDTGDAILDLNGLAPDLGTYNVYPDPSQFTISITASSGCEVAPVITDGTCATLSANGWQNNMPPASGCSTDVATTNDPVDGTFEWTQDYSAYTWFADAQAAGCVYPDDSGTEIVAGCEDNAACNCDLTCPDDGDCSNGTEMLDAVNCVCIQVNVPDPSTCVDDGDCSNGEEVYNAATCVCEQINIPDPSTCVDDGDCSNGEETWNAATCTCEQLNIPDPSTCVDDGDCSNGEEVYNAATCVCEQVNVPDPSTCTDTDVCTNGGAYVYDAATCECVIDVATVDGCTDNTACNFDPNANCDDNSCVFTGCTEGCTDPCAPNYDMDADIDDGSCQPYDTTCDTDLCTNGGAYVYDPSTCDCVLDVATVEGCTDPLACNFDPNANCDTGCDFTGDVCDDNNPDTGSDQLDANCDCVGLVSLGIMDPCDCDSPDNIDLDGDGDFDLVIDVITITGPAGDTWTLSVNPMATPALDIAGFPLATDGSVTATEDSMNPGTYTLEVYHPADGTGYGPVTFTSGNGYDDLSISNQNTCVCSEACTIPNPGTIECND